MAALSSYDRWSYNVRTEYLTRGENKLGNADVSQQAHYVRTEDRTRQRQSVYIAKRILAKIFGIRKYFTRINYTKGFLLCRVRNTVFLSIIWTTGTW